MLWSLAADVRLWRASYLESDQSGVEWACLMLKNQVSAPDSPVLASSGLRKVEKNAKSRAGTEQRKCVRDFFFKSPPSVAPSWRPQLASQSSVCHVLFFVRVVDASSGRNRHQVGLILRLRLSI